ncbi:zinc finger, CCHC-type containing protein [Tanacetum coccineum]
MHLSKNRGLGVAQLEYSRIIGMLMYLMTGTRPDLAYAVSRLSRYTSNPSYAHWKAITRVLHYLRYSRDYGLHYDRHPAVIEGYSDANWISDIKDSRSTSGYVFTLGGAAISWKSSKQTVIAKSTMESEFIALDKCGEEAEWLRQFVEDIPRWPKPVTAISIHCDSKSAMGRAKSTMYNGKSRHIRRRHNSIRQLLSTGVISIDYVASKDNIADPFTKGLSRELVSKYVKSGCTTALNVVPWEIDGESVLREAQRIMRLVSYIALGLVFEKVFTALSNLTEKETTTSELPSNLILMEILPRLPIKLLGRCMCVCKEWKSFLSTPKFAKMHHNYDGLVCLAAMYTQELAFWNPLTRAFKKLSDNSSSPRFYKPSCTLYPLRYSPDKIGPGFSFSEVKDDSNVEEAVLHDEDENYWLAKG